MFKSILKFKIFILGKSFSLQDLIGNPVLTGSAIMIIGSNMANFFAYIYHVVFGRLLDPSLYGELAATFSITGMIASALTFIGLVIVKFVSSSDSKNESGKLFSWFVTRGALLGGILCLLFLLFTPQLSTFLHINPAIVYFIGPVVFLSVITLIYKSFLQGLIQFKENILIINIEMIGKLIFGLIFVYLGFGVLGAMIGLFVSYIVGVLLGAYFLRGYKVRKVSTVSVDTKKLFDYSLPILISSIAINSLLLLDLILVKHLFTPYEAGIYASVATLGKIIFFGTAPVASVMFPLVSKKHSQGESYTKVFLLSMGLTLCIAIGVITIFLITPDLIIQSVYGNKYDEARDYLAWYGLFILLFTLASLLLNFYLSIGKTKIISVAVITALSQVIGIWFYHESLLQVISVSILSSLFFFICLAVYFFKETRQSSKK